MFDFGIINLEIFILQNEQLNNLLKCCISQKKSQGRVMFLYIKVKEYKQKYQPAQRRL